MAEAYRLYAGTQSGMIIFRGVGDIWTSMGGSREFEPYFKRKSWIPFTDASTTQGSFLRA